MPRRRKKEVTEATRTAIKDTARRLMAEKGTGGLSLRGIARELDMTAPALYHYYDSMDDIITALIVDAFTGYAEHIRQARDAAGDSLVEKLLAAAHAYRTWAMANTVEFQLIYGNPIPGYIAPAAITTPAAQSIGAVFMELLMPAVQAGELTFAAEYERIPPEIEAHYRDKYGMDATTAPVFHVMNHAWSHMHGLVTLEVYNHLGPVVEDTAAFYEQSVRTYFASLGLPID